MKTIPKGSKIIDHTNDKEFFADDENNPEIINGILQYEQEKTVFKKALKWTFFVLVESDDFEIVVPAGEIAP